MIRYEGLVVLVFAIDDHNDQEACLCVMNIVVVKLRDVAIDSLRKVLISQSPRSFWRFKSVVRARFCVFIVLVGGCL